MRISDAFTPPNVAFGSSTSLGSGRGTERGRESGQGAGNSRSRSKFLSVSMSMSMFTKGPSKLQGGGRCCMSRAAAGGGGNVPPGTGCELTRLEACGLKGSIWSVSGIGKPPRSTTAAFTPLLAGP